jgi:hypothetical protein
MTERKYQLGDKVTFVSTEGEDYKHYIVGEEYTVTKLDKSAGRFLIQLDSTRWNVWEEQVVPVFNLDKVMEDLGVTLHEAREGFSIRREGPSISYGVHNKKEAQQVIVGCLALLKHWDEEE